MFTTGASMKHLCKPVWTLSSCVALFKYEDNERIFLSNWTDVTFKSEKADDGGFFTSKNITSLLSSILFLPRHIRCGIKLVQKERQKKRLKWTALSKDYSSFVWMDCFFLETWKKCWQPTVHVSAHRTDVQSSCSFVIEPFKTNIKWCSELHFVPSEILAHRHNNISALLPGDGGDPYPLLCVGVLVLGDKLDRPSASLGNWCIVLHTTKKKKQTIIPFLHVFNKPPLTAGRTQQAIVWRVFSKIAALFSVTATDFFGCHTKHAFSTPL